MSEQLEKLRELLSQLARWEKSIEESLVYTRGTHTFDDVVGQVLQGKLEFHSFPGAFAILEKVNYPQYSVLHCFLSGGDIEAVLSLADTPMHRRGVELDCRYLSIGAGRKGWERALRGDGWEPVCTTLFKEVRVEQQHTEQLTFWPTYDQPAH